jgi:hypothetical protein
VPWASVKQYDLLSDVTIDDGQPRGLRFRVSVFPSRVNSATFQLECAYEPPRGKTTLPLYRFEWNPISGHQNAFDVPDDGLAGRTFYPGETHEHSCLDHVSGSGFVKSGGVHCARPILLDAANFHDALTYVCVRIHLIGVAQIGNPEEQWQLV